MLQFDGPDEFDSEPAPTGPLLLERQRGHADIAGILADLPEKGIADKLVSRYFNSAEPAIGAFCSGTGKQAANFCSAHSCADFSATGKSQQTLHFG